MRAALAALVVVALAAGCGGSGTRNGFSARVTNAWFPLRSGSVYRYRGVKDGQPSREVMTVTRRTRTIDGARTVAVSDLLYLRGRLEERTTDYYSQDRDGNVWYFGEDTAELDRDGKVKDTSGSWLAGKDGAKPGIFMYAHPRAGQSARQEYLKGEAEDHFQVLRLGERVTVPFESFGDALLTKEWTPLEPGVLDHKFYARGIGTVLEQTVKGGNERNELVSFSR
ncbi:MAG TPA: hypothetical protein VLD16_03260 [Gaiellaceae bacterium]|nr:hypothetical protein [Gaiellaceae bacterium]